MVLTWAIWCLHEPYRAPVEELNKLITISWIRMSFLSFLFLRAPCLMQECDSNALVQWTVLCPSGFIEKGGNIKRNILHVVCLKCVSSRPLSPQNTRKRKLDHIRHYYLTESREEIVTQQVSRTIITPSIYLSPRSVKVCAQPEMKLYPNIT